MIRTRTATLATQLSLLFALCASACSFQSAPLHYFDPKTDVYISSDFSPEQADVVVSALTSWSEATNGQVQLRARIGEGSPRIRPARERDGVVGEFIPSESPQIVLDVTKASEPRELRNLALHEVGHALGLQHIEHVDSVMFPIANVVQELDPWTLAAWQRLNTAPADDHGGS